MPAQSDWTRVKDPVTGHERSTLVPLEGEEILDKPAADVYGQPLPTKHNRPLSSLAGADGKPVTEMTVPELLDYSQANGIVLADDKPKKTEILVAIAEREGVDESTPSASAGGDSPAS